MRILAIDPGLANTGVVLFVDGRIHAVQTIRTEGDGFKVDFDLALERIKSIAVDLSIAIERARPDEIACEKYKDIPGELRKAANRWSTPLAIGYLVAAVFEDWQHSGVVIAYQDPERVMTLYRQHVAAWKAGHRGIAPGDELLTNEHLRSAAAHGLYRMSATAQQWEAMEQARRLEVRSLEKTKHGKGRKQ